MAYGLRLSRCEHPHYLPVVGGGHQRPAGYVEYVDHASLHVCVCPAVRCVAGLEFNRFRDKAGRRVPWVSRADVGGGFCGGNTDRFSDGLFNRRPQSGGLEGTPAGAHSPVPVYSPPT